MARSIIEDEDLPANEEDEAEEVEAPKAKTKIAPKSIPKSIPKSAPTEEAETEVKIITENQFIINQLSYIAEQNEAIIKGLKKAGINLD